MAFTYEDVTPSFIPNTVMRKRLLNGVDYQYLITPAEGYVMHDTEFDSSNPIFDENGDLIGSEIVLGYRPHETSVSINYEFTPIQMQDEAGNTVTAYGDRLFYCKLASDVPADQIFGTVEPDHEVM